MAGLNTDQRRALHVLAYLMLRMGREASAGRLYAGLAALAPEGQPDRQAQAGLAALAVNRGDGAEALRLLKDVLAGSLSSRQAALHLLKAQALWLEGREEEARAERDTYMFLAGEGKKA